MLAFFTAHNSAVGVVGGTARLVPVRCLLDKLGVHVLLAANYGGRRNLLVGYARVDPLLFLVVAKKLFVRQGLRGNGLHRNLTVHNTLDFWIARNRDRLYFVNAALFV